MFSTVMLFPAALMIFSYVIILILMSDIVSSSSSSSPHPCAYYDRIIGIEFRSLDSGLAESLFRRNDYRNNNNALIVPPLRVRTASTLPPIVIDAITPQRRIKSASSSSISTTPRWSSPSTLTSISALNYDVELTMRSTTQQVQQVLRFTAPIQVTSSSSSLLSGQALFDSVTMSLEGTWNTTFTLRQNGIPVASNTESGSMSSSSSSSSSPRIYGPLITVANNDTGTIQNFDCRLFHYHRYSPATVAAITIDDIRQFPIVAPSRLKFLPSSANVWKFTDLTSSSSSSSSYAQLLPSSDNLISGRTIPFENATISLTQGQPFPPFRIAILSTLDLSPWSCYVNFSSTTFMSSFASSTPLGRLVMRATAYGSRLGAFAEEVVAEVRVVQTTASTENDPRLGFELNNGEIFFDSLKLDNFLGLVEVRFTLYDGLRGENVRHVAPLSIFAVVSRVTRPAASLVFVRRGSLSSLWHDPRNDHSSYTLKKYKKAGVGYFPSSAKTTTTIRTMSHSYFGFDSTSNSALLSVRASTPLPVIAVHTVTSSDRADEVSSGIVVKAYCDSASLINNVATLVSGMAVFSRLEIVDGSFSEDRLHVIRFEMVRRMKDVASSSVSSSSVGMDERNHTTPLYSRPFRIYSSSSSSSSTPALQLHDQRVRRFAFDKTNRAVPFEYSSLVVEANRPFPEIRLVITDALGEIINDPYATQQADNLMVAATLIPLRSNVNITTLLIGSSTSTSSAGGGDSSSFLNAQLKHLNVSFSTSADYSNASFFGSSSSSSSSSLFSSSSYFRILQRVTNGFRIRFTLYDTSRTSAPKHPLHGASVSTGPITVLPSSSTSSSSSSSTTSTTPMLTASFSPLLSLSSINQEGLISATESSGSVMTPSLVVVDGDTLPTITIDLLDMTGKDIARGNSYTGFEAVVSGGKCRISNGVSYAFRGQVTFRKLRLYDCYAPLSINSRQDDDHTTVTLRFIHKTQSNAAVDQTLIAAYSFLDMVAGQIMVLPTQVQQHVVQEQTLLRALKMAPNNPQDPNIPTSGAVVDTTGGGGGGGGGSTGGGSGGGSDGNNNNNANSKAAAHILATTDWVNVPSHLQVEVSNNESSSGWATHRARAVLSGGSGSTTTTTTSRVPTTWIQVGCAATNAPSSSSSSSSRISSFISSATSPLSNARETEYEQQKQQRLLLSQLSPEIQDSLSSLQRGKISSASSFSPSSPFVPSCSIRGNWIGVHSLLRSSSSSSSSSLPVPTQYQFITRNTANTSFDDLVLSFDSSIQRTLTIQFCSDTALIPCMTIPIRLLQQSSSTNANNNNDLSVSILSQPSPAQILPSTNILTADVGWGGFFSAASNSIFTAYPRNDYLSVAVPSLDPTATSLTSIDSAFLGSGRADSIQATISPRRNNLLKDTLVSIQYFIPSLFSSSSSSSNSNNNNHDLYSSPASAWSLPLTIEPESPSDFLDPSLKHLVAILDIPYPRFDEDRWKRLVSDQFHISPDRIVIERASWSWRTTKDDGPQGSRTKNNAGGLRVGTRVEFHLDLPTTLTEVKLPISITELQMMTFRDSCSSAKVDLHIAALFDGDNRQYSPGSYGASVRQQEHQALAAAGVSSSSSSSVSTQCDRRYFEDRLESARHCEAYGTLPGTGSSTRCPCFNPVFTEHVAAQCLDEDITIRVCDYLRDCMNSYPAIDNVCSVILPNRTARVFIVLFSTIGVLVIVGLYEKYKTKTLRNFKKVKIRGMGDHDNDGGANGDYRNVEATFV